MGVYYETVAGKRFEKYQEMMIIDSLVKTYPQYSHNDIFYMEFQLVYNLLLMNKEQAYVNAEANHQYNEVQKARRK